jgi:hypothetical protein
MRLLVLVCSAFLVPAAASAAPPAGTDPSSPESRWYHGLIQPGSRMDCCGMADCRPVVARQHGNHWEVFIDPAQFREGTGEWTVVPDDKILHGHDNPTGEPVACWTKSLGVLCFVETVQG